MSSSEVERFVSDLKTDDGLRSTLAEHASGVGSVVSFANEKGYEITVEEAGAYIQAQASNELRDDQLDAIAGGVGKIPGAHYELPPGFQTTQMVSTVAISAVVVTLT
jgi:predicted ribosomally synthesized peptide with nif11-like leader